MGQHTTYEDNFEDSGPKHIGSGSIDWKNAENSRCITACLVKATYVMDKDMLMAAPWWDSFGFKLKECFFTDSRIDAALTYGAIFELMVPSGPSAPKYVVAFRGTMLLHNNVFLDMVQNTLLLFNAQAEYMRFKETHWSVDKLISDSSSGSVWLTGHSLGASLALEIGRTMMLEKGLNIPPFLFNPPHVSPAPVINKILSEENKTRLYTGSYALKFVLANILPWHRKRTKRLFEQLAPWVPELYVNPADWICQGFRDYFEERQQFADNHPRFASTAARTSYRDMIFFRTLRPQLLPSARLWKNCNMKTEPHGLRQWWKPDSDLMLVNEHYCYPLN